MVYTISKRAIYEYIYIYVYMFVSSRFAMHIKFNQKNWLNNESQIKKKLHTVNIIYILSVFGFAMDIVCFIVIFIRLTHFGLVLLWYSQN